MQMHMTEVGHVTRHDMWHVCNETSVAGPGLGGLRSRSRSKGRMSHNRWEYCRVLSLFHKVQKDFVSKMDLGLVSLGLYLNNFEGFWQLSKIFKALCKDLTLFLMKHNKNNNCRIRMTGKLTPQ